MPRPIAIAKAKGRPGAPVVLADYADNPGGGGYGDTPGLLRAMIEAKLENAAFSPFYDPESAAQCHAAGAGSDREAAGSAARSIRRPLAVPSRSKRR